MIEVFPNLFISDAQDFEESEVQFKKDWAVIQACKEPYHRQALGYTGKSAPKTSPEYLVAKRGNRLILNLVDAREAKFISKVCINTAIQFIEKELDKGNKVLVHCNKGQSRSAGIALLFLKKKGLVNAKDFLKAEEEFEDLYYPCLFSTGIREYLEKQWNETDN